MAKAKDTTTDLATVPEVGALVSEEFKRAMAVAEGVDDTDVRGREGIDPDEDLLLPRLDVVQSLSPQRDEEHAEYIPDIKEGDLFDTLTRTNYGKGPLHFAVLRVFKNAMQFDDDRNVVDFDVPWDDPRCEFTVGADGTRQKPVATRFYNFIVYLLGPGIPVVLRMANTKVPVAKRLMQLMSLRPGPTWAGLYSLTTTKEKGPKGTYYNFKIDLAGPTPAPLLPKLEGLYASYTPDRVTIHNAEGAADAPAAGGSTDDVPF
jgi:hypothetical protein